MIFGLSLSAFTTLQVIVSLLAIAAGLSVVGGTLGARRLPGTSAVFLAGTVLTSVTGLLSPFSGRLPAPVLAILSLVVLALLLPIGGVGAAPASRPW